MQGRRGETWFVKAKCGKVWHRRPGVVWHDLERRGVANLARQARHGQVRSGPIRQGRRD